MNRVALAGNPNVGKSTLFNALTGLRQHTGNWAGKTVATARGEYSCGGREYQLIDLPGTYSLAAHSQEEAVARDYIESGQADGVVVVCDATCLERNLILVLQVLELTGKVLVCVNLMDEAKRLLDMTSKTAAEIGSYLGYSSQSHFQRVFKKAVGMTPGEYRKG